jgi:hypothetical protein
MLPVAVEKVLADVHLFMGSEEGRRAVRAALQRRRLPGFFDVEIEEAVLGEALRFLRGGGEMVSVPGWCRARVNARAIDLARGVLREERRFGVRVPFDDAFDDAFGDAFGDGLEDELQEELRVEFLDEFRDEPQDVSPLFAGDAGAVVDKGLDGVRRGLLASGADDVAVAGALTFVSRVGEEVVPVPECPQPRAGADAEEAAVWVALWYLGLRDCFGPGNTMAKRRSRAAGKVRSLLRELLGNTSADTSGSTSGEFSGGEGRVR